MEIFRGKRFKSFLEEAEKEKKNLLKVISSLNNIKKIETTSEKLQEELEPLPTSPMSDE